MRLRASYGGIGKCGQTSGEDPRDAAQGIADAGEENAAIAASCSLANVCIVSWQSRSTCMTQRFRIGSAQSLHHLNAGHCSGTLGVVIG